MPFQEGNSNGRLYGFQKGQSGNPAGRIKNSPALKSAQLLAKGLTEDAITALREVAAQTSDCRARVLAAEAILNRGWGKPVETKNLNLTRTIHEIDDNELAAIAATGRRGIAIEAPGENEPGPVY